jgi:hypothetical protein
MSPLTPTQQGSSQAIQALNQALQANAGAYAGLENQAQQQYQQNAGAVNANLTNAGLGNTTVAQTMQQAPLQTLNNAMLNITGQQQGQAANLYGQEAGVYNQTGNALSNLLMAQGNQGLQQQQIAANTKPAIMASPVVQRGI